MDPAHSEILFSARHMMIAKVRGQFDQFEVSADLNEDNPAQSTLDVKINADSINTRVDDRDTHLRSADFLDVENYPFLLFKSKRVEVIDDHHAKLFGDLTIRDITNEVIMDIEYLGQSKSPYGHTSAGFEGTTRIKRDDWGLKWNVPLETGGVLVGSHVNINIQLEVIKQEEAEPAG